RATGRRRARRRRWARTRRGARPGRRRCRPPGAGRVVPRLPRLRARSHRAGRPGPRARRPRQPHSGAPIRMTDTLAALLRAFDRGVLVYFLSLNTIYLLLIVTAVVEFSRQCRRQALTGQDATFANPLTPGVSILIP